jgi:hypothetical protein
MFLGCFAFVDFGRLARNPDLIVCHQDLRVGTFGAKVGILSVVPDDFPVPEAIPICDIDERIAFLHRVHYISRAWGHS